VEHVTPADGNIFADIGFPPAEARTLLLRAKLMARIEDLIHERRLTQARAAKLFGVTQPRVSDVIRRKAGRFSIDMLIAMLTRAGVTVDVTCDVGRAA
jgi:predicted XRE-type DNA-binding protein